jgi:assimilatory nitrate reductase catalytic subunit
MTRTGLSPRLGSHIQEPFATLHPLDAQTNGVVDGGFVRVTSRHGAAILRAHVSDAQRCGEIFAPIHWSAETSSNGRIGALVQPATDCFSGQPELKATATRAEPMTFRQEGFIITRHPLVLPPEIWSARISLDQAYGFSIATDSSAEKIAELITTQIGPCAHLEYHDAARGDCRIAFLADGILKACLFVSSGQQKPDWGAIKLLFRENDLDANTRRLLLSGCDASGLSDQGPTICACFGISLHAIRDLVTSGRAKSTEEIGAVLKAGTNCGSCVPELRRLIKQ